MRNVILSFLMLATLPLYADWSDIKSKEFTSLKDFPADGSAAYKKDFEILHKEKANRTDVDCKRSQSQRYPDFKNLFAYSGLNLLSKVEAERVEEFVEHVLQFSERVAGYYKTKYARARPYSVDASIDPCTYKPSGATSYPSSHAVMATIGASVLGELFPDRADKFAEHGAYLADLRVRVGVHHPSDVKAGKDLASEIWERLQKEDDFNAELNALK